MLIIAIASFLITKDLNSLAPVLEGGMSGGGASQTSGQPYTPSAAEEELKDFVSVVLADTEVV
ncbi:MAG: hypothetical protein ACI9TH_005024 [Kiritimatiellia bacterium]